MSDQSTFLSNAVNDTQSTIRSMDMKLSVLLTLLLLPTAKLWYIVEYYKLLHLRYNNCLGNILIAIIFLTWFLAIYIAVIAIGAISNPAQHVKNGGKYSGIYYLGKIYSNFNIIDSIYNRKSIKSSKSVSELKQEIDDPDTDLDEELLFELAKLAYIRDIKIYRFKWAINSATATFAFAIISYFIFGFHFTPIKPPTL